MAWSKYMEDNQDYYTENMSRHSELPKNGVDINGVVYGRGSQWSRSSQQDSGRFRESGERSNPGKRRL